MFFSNFPPPATNSGLPKTKVKHFRLVKDVSYCARGLVLEPNNGSDFRQEQTAIPQYNNVSLQFYAYKLTILIR